MPATPTYTWPLLNARCSAEVWLKHENHSPVGAFKLRTATVYIDWLRREHPEIKHVVAATRGNYGQGVASAAKGLGLKATIVVPHDNSHEKNRAMKALGADLVEHGDDFQAANEHATELAERMGAHKIPSFDRLLVIGAGTFALEMFEAVPDLDTVYVPVGMGSSICGIAAAREALGLKTKIVGVGSTAAPATRLSVAAGRIVPHAVGATIADGVSCRLPVESALGVMLQHMERFVEVDDSEIRAAMRAIYEDTHNVAEGAGAAAVAAVLQEKDRVKGKRVGAVITGGNVDRETFAAVLEGA
jgi:threonine dehydratase